MGVLVGSWIYKSKAQRMVWKADRSEGVLVRRCYLMPQARWTHTGTSKKAKPGNSALIGWEDEKVEETERETRDRINSRRERTHGSQGNWVLEEKEEASQPNLTCTDAEAGKWWEHLRSGVSRPGADTSLSGMQFLIYKMRPRHQPRCAGIIASPTPFLPEGTPVLLE